MLKKMVRHGNSSALIIDRPIMELLDIDHETPLEISTDGRNIIISPVKDAARLIKLDSALERINRKHAATLKKLAE